MREIENYQKNTMARSINDAELVGKIRETEYFQKSEKQFQSFSPKCIYNFKKENSHFTEEKLNQVITVDITSSKLY